MRIISKFKDYYDCGLSQGIDTDILYVRERKDLNPEVLFENWRDHAYSRAWAYSGQHFSDYHLSVGFCGKVYPLVVIHYFDRPTCFNRHPFVGVEKWYFFYSLEEMEPHCKRIGIEIDNTLTWNYTTWGKARDHFKAAGKHLEGLFHEHKVPIFIKADKATLLNPCLKDFEFFKVIDAWTAFQELSMFIPGVLGGANRPMVEVGEEHRIAGHGYDKQSFRMAPHSKPNRKRKKKGRK